MTLVWIFGVWVSFAMNFCTEFHHLRLRNIQIPTEGACYEFLYVIFIVDLIGSDNVINLLTSE